ncbi:MAG: asparagine synthase (glutamine-hydrolyzing), partial [Nitrospirota bacterium]
MCGICGIFFREKNQWDHSSILRMCAKIRHRGPDDEGIYTDPLAHLGMRRLNIIDLETGHQPIHNEDKTVWTVFNGEIYNFPDLRKALINKGHRFYTLADTEVIIHLYEEYEEDFIKHLRGMFAIALWDTKTKSGYLVRDRLGIKPLYYTKTPLGIVFGSEIKTILEAPVTSAEMDISSLNDYITFGYIPEPKSIFKNIHKLSPGTFLKIQHGDVKERCYWKLSDFAPEKDYGESYYLEGILEQIREAVKIRLISDVPLGAFLSGGIDSSMVVAIMSELLDKPVKTFTIGFDETVFDETGYARTSASHFGAEHHELVVRPDFITMIDDISYILDEPFADQSVIPTYYVSRLAREKVTVVLSGDGGDELFGGYETYIWALKEKRYNWFPYTLKTLLRGISQIMPYGFYGKNYLEHIALNNEERFINSISTSIQFKKRLFSNDFIKRLTSLDNSGIFHNYLNEIDGRDFIDKILYLDIKTYLVGDILTKVDRMSMGHSLEARVPLLDHKLVEFACKIPASYKIRNMVSKY